jgi:transposase
LPETFKQKEDGAMAKGKDTQSIRVLHRVCCGLDVHKKSISACLLSLDPQGEEQLEVRQFGAFTKDLIELRDWLVSEGCPIVAMESTGVYWRPVHNILEGSVNVMLVNARHVKNVPGRKTDVADCIWLAGLLRHGLVKGSFIPEKDVRQWRELERLRRSHIETLGDYKRRVHKLFETANIKIDSVVSDLFGVTGRNLIDLLCAENADLSADNIAKCTKGSLRSKVDELCNSVQGFFQDHHRFQLRGIMRVIFELEQQIKSITDRLTDLLKPHEELIRRLDEIPGVNEIGAQNILSHIGVTLNEFDNAGALCVWAGLSPGNNRSADKQKSGRNPVRSHPFKTIMIEIAWAAVKKRDSYYKDKYHRLKARLGPNKAITAIGHRIAKAIYHIVKNGESFKDLGENYLNLINKSNRLRNLKNQARKLGFNLVAIEA